MSDLIDGLLLATGAVGLCWALAVLGEIRRERHAAALEREYRAFQTLMQTTPVRLEGTDPDRWREQVADRLPPLGEAADYPGVGVAYVHRPPGPIHIAGQKEEAYNYE